MPAALRTRRTVLVLGGLMAAALVFGGMYWTGYDPPLHHSITDPELPEQEREAAVLQLVRDTPAADRPRLIRRAARATEGQDLARLVLVASMDVEPAAADPVLDAFLDRYPDPYWAPLWRIRLRTKQGRIDEAVALFQERTAEVRDEDGERNGALYTFLEAMAAAGRPVEGYQAADSRDVEYAFQVLAGFLERPDDRLGHAAPAHDQLRAVIAAHRARVGETPWTVFHTGVIQQAEGNFEAAQATYADCTRRLNDADLGPVRMRPPRLEPQWEDRTWERARDRRTECLYRLGRWEQAYSECHPADRTFHQLAQRFEGQKEWDALAKLIAKHRDRVPQDARSDLWQAVAHFGKGEYAAAIPPAEKYLAQVTYRQGQDHRAFQVKFRSEVRLGRVEDARKTHAAEARHFPRLTAMMVLALMDGNAAEAERLFAEYARNRTGPCPWRELYDDEDAGRLLRSEPWAALRAKYPPP